MIVLRSDLLAGFKNKLFEINVKNQDNIDISLENNILVCNFTSRIEKNGFRVSGNIVNNVLYNCDRCLEPFCNNNKVKTNLILTNDSEKIKNDNYEIIYFSDQKNSIDLKNVLLEMLLVETPLKNLCTSSCKGLCSECGFNLNVCSCSN